MDEEKEADDDAPVEATLSLSESLEEAKLLGLRTDEARAAAVEAAEKRLFEAWEGALARLECTRRPPVAFVLNRLLLVMTFVPCLQIPRGKSGNRRCILRQDAVTEPISLYELSRGSLMSSTAAHPAFRLQKETNRGGLAS
jgi:hypothetical protein